MCHVKDEKTRKEVKRWIQSVGDEKNIDALGLKIQGTGPWYFFSKLLEGGHWCWEKFQGMMSYFKFYRLLFWQLS